LICPDSEARIYQVSSFYLNCWEDKKHLFNLEINLRLLVKNGWPLFFITEIFIGKSAIQLTGSYYGMNALNFSMLSSLAPQQIGSNPHGN
jgi:hypothetical protein